MSVLHASPPSWTALATIAAQGREPPLLSKPEIPTATPTGQPPKPAPPRAATTPSRPPTLRTQNPPSTHARHFTRQHRQRSRNRAGRPSLPTREKGKREKKEAAATNPEKKGGKKGNTKPTTPGKIRQDRGSNLLPSEVFTPRLRGHPRRHHPRTRQAAQHCTCILSVNRDTYAP